MDHPEAGRRVVRVGGFSKGALLAELHRNGIGLNDAAQALFADERFTTSAEVSDLETVEVSVADLGLVEGGTTDQIHEGAAALGLALCPLELGPHFRLQFLDQPEGFWGHPPSQYRAPPGSITIASAPLADEYDVPKGFYLRRIEGRLWLRGYRCSEEHLWSPEDRLVFCRPSGNE